MADLTVNCNTMVQVELTAEGRNVYRLYLDAIPGKFRPDMPADGIVTMPLWEIMQLFGPHTAQFLPVLFVSNKIVLKGVG